MRKLNLSRHSNFIRKSKLFKCRQKYLISYKKYLGKKSYIIHRGFKTRVRYSPRRRRFRTSPFIRFGFRIHGDHVLEFNPIFGAFTRLHEQKPYLSINYHPVTRKHYSKKHMQPNHYIYAIMPPIGIKFNHSTQAAWSLQWETGTYLFQWSNSLYKRSSQFFERTKRQISFAALFSGRRSTFVTANQSVTVRRQRIGLRNTKPLRCCLFFLIREKFS